MQFSHYQAKLTLVACLPRVMTFLDCKGMSTGGPRYMQSFYLRIRVYAIEKWPFFWNLSSNLQ